MIELFFLTYFLTNIILFPLYRRNQSLSGYFLYIHHVAWISFISCFYPLMSILLVLLIALNLIYTKTIANI